MHCEEHQEGRFVFRYWALVKVPRLPWTVAVYFTRDTAISSVRPFSKESTINSLNTISLSVFSSRRCVQVFPIQFVSLGFQRAGFRARELELAGKSVGRDRERPERNMGLFKIALIWVQSDGFSVA